MVVRAMEFHVHGKFGFLCVVLTVLINCENRSYIKEKVRLGFIWENPRLEQHSADEVIVDGRGRELRLTCILDPPLPVTKENFLARDSIVKWTKIHKTHGHKLKDTFWSDDQTITAISLSGLTLRQLGTYGCSYKTFLKMINITVSNIEEVKRLPVPLLHSDLEGVIMNIKDFTGMDKWNPFPLQQNGNLGADFPCNIPSTKKVIPNSVHRLQPGDIDIIISLGGAISAGVAANASTVPGLFASHKTLSFSIGGKLKLEDMVTLPSILKKFNPNLKGAVVQQESFTTMHYGTSLRYLPARAKALIAKLKNRQDIDYDLSWKLLTFSLDFDDYCVACRIKTQWDARIKATVEALDILSKVPRLYVNLVLPPNVTQLYRDEASKQCPMLFRKRCECLDSTFAEDQNDVSLMLHDFKSHLKKVIQKYNSKSDFAVVMQPFWSDIYSVKDNLFAKDCFHLSVSGHEYAAINLWNNMLQPLGSKNSRWLLNKRFLCPTEDRPYLYTAVNTPKDAVIDLSIDSSNNAKSSNVKKSTSKLKIGLGIGLTLFIIIIFVAVVVVLRRNKTIPLSAKIRILATPWKRMKEKI